jgi:ABC-2 type transport system ATP-binding protein
MAALLLALAARPRVLLMDEPFSGLDVRVREELSRGILSAAAEFGTTVIIASHDISEIETMADHMLILSNGRLRASGDIEAVQRRFLRLRVAATQWVLDDLIERGTWLAIERSGRQAQVVADQDLTPIDASNLEARYPSVESVVVEPLSLRDLCATLAAQRTEESSTEAE